MDEACFVVDPPAGWRLPAAYLAAMFAVAAASAGLLAAFGRAAPNDVVADVSSAVLVDLPPAPAPAAPPGSDVEARPSEAAVADAPPVVEEKPEADATPKPTSEAPVLVPPAPGPADLAAEPATAPPPTAATPQAAPQEAEAPAGADAPAPQPEAAPDEGRPTAAAHLVSIWQKALMARLEAAKRGLGHARRLTGVAEIAFAIDRDGRLTSEAVRRTSGSDTLDRAALALVRQAAPFPPSPAGVRDADLSFVVPIRFRR